MPDEEQGAYQHRRPLAPIAAPWHTAALILLISSVAVAGTLLGRSGEPRPAVAPDGRLGIYLPMVVVPWMLTLYVAYVGRTGHAQRGLGPLLGRGWRRASDAVVDLALAVGLAVAVRLLEHLLEHLLGPAADAKHAAAVAAVLPQSATERAAWIAVAASTAFGEEVVYRGYLQIQLGALTRSRAAGVALQALLFGIAHLEQGPAAAGRVALYGLLLGVLVQVRRSLLPGILAHALVDAAAAFVR
jgi:membrane protease YdiL (CAAX protease family)